MRRTEMKNSKLRKESIKEFNNAVREFAYFIRKLDPRYISYLKSSEIHFEALRCAAAAQSARSKAVSQKKLENCVVPDWANFRDPSDNEEEVFVLKSEKSEQNPIECVVCRKTFKSKAQYHEHEKSKKHSKAVKQLTWELEQDMKFVNLGSLDNTESPYHIKHDSHSG